MRTLIVGAGGSIGRVLMPGLCEQGHRVIGADLVSAPPPYEGAWHTVDVSDPSAVEAAVGAQPLDAIVHLAGNPDETDLPTALHSHVLTTASLLEAMVGSGVSRIVYASSNHAVGRTPRTAPGELLGCNIPPRPDTFYGVAKVAAEALLSLYSDRYGFNAVACRIGSFLPRPKRRRHLATWLSHDDCVRMVDAALSAHAPGFSVLYGISANTRAWWDLKPGRRLGYHPVDDAEDFAESVSETEEDGFHDSYVGGPLIDAAHHRPALPH